MNKKTVVSLGDLKELWYLMEKPCEFNEFVESYIEDEEYEVIGSWVCENI